jgi:hypothetical protein
MSAGRLARGSTGRTKVVKFAGCYLPMSLRCPSIQHFRSPVTLTAIGAFGWPAWGGEKT